MTKNKNLIQALMEFIFWIAIFLSPVFLFGLIALWFYASHHNLPAILIGISGIILGILYAEYVRRKYGCSVYMGRILGTPDFWPTLIDQKKNKNETQDKNKSS